MCPYSVAACRYESLILPSVDGLDFEAKNDVSACALILRAVDLVREETYFRFGRRVEIQAFALRTTTLLR